MTEMYKPPTSLTRFLDEHDGIVSVHELARLLVVEEHQVRAFARRSNVRRIGATFAFGRDTALRCYEELMGMASAPTEAPVVTLGSSITDERLVAYFEDRFHFRPPGYPVVIEGILFSVPVAVRGISSGALSIALAKGYPQPALFELPWEPTEYIAFPIAHVLGVGCAIGCHLDARPHPDFTATLYYRDC